jgi:hypothetical protein
LLPLTLPFRAASAAVLIGLAVLGAGGCGRSGNDHLSAKAVPDGNPTKTGDRLKACLDATALIGYGAPNPNQGDPNAADYEVFASEGEKGGPGALIAVYTTAAKAEALLADVVANMTRANGVSAASSTVEQHGSVTVIWLPDPPSDETRGAVYGCLG